MRKDINYYRIGLLPNTGPFSGKSPQERILNYVNIFKKEKNKNSTDFLKLYILIKTKKYFNAKTLFWNLDTAVRDTFVNIYTNNYKNKKITIELKKILDIL